MAKKIIHIIPNQKFTRGYLNFMQQKYSCYDHFFYIISSSGHVFFHPDSSNEKMVECLNSAESLHAKYIREQLLSANKIIVSGLFNRIHVALSRLPNSILRKIYIQFWGGDFYGYRFTKKFSKKWVSKILVQSCINRCAAIITLVPDDYKELSKIFPNSKPHFVASVPYDPEQIDDYEKYLNKGSNSHMILLGNSATPENYHIEMMRNLKHLKDSDIEIMCPLSYGDLEYANKVISVGEQIFGKRFIKVTNYQSFEEYKKMLSKCSVGIFANDRQQAMGNIGIMMMMGKKVYLREGTSMWNSYVDYGIELHSISELSTVTVDELFKFNKKSATENAKRIRMRDGDYDNNWGEVLAY